MALESTTLEEGRLESDGSRASFPLSFDLGYFTLCRQRVGVTKAWGADRVALSVLAPPHSSSL